jgi:hypothetical protein
MTSAIIKYFKIPDLLRVLLYITVDPETQTHQNGIWSCKLSLMGKHIQNITYQLLSSLILVSLCYICRVKQITFLTHTFQDPPLCSNALPRYFVTHCIRLLMLLLRQGARHSYDLSVWETYCSYFLTEILVSIILSRKEPKCCAKVIFSFTTSRKGGENIYSFTCIKLLIGLNTVNQTKYCK